MQYISNFAHNLQSIRILRFFGNKKQSRKNEAKTCLGESTV